MYYDPEDENNKISDAEIFSIKLKSLENDFINYCRYSGAERFFLCLLCGFSTTVFLPSSDFLTFLFQIIGSFVFALLVMLTHFLFPKEKARFWLGSFYENHPYIYAIICFIFFAAIITIYRYVKGEF